MGVPLTSLGIHTTDSTFRHQVTCARNRVNAPIPGLVVFLGLAVKNNGTISGVGGTLVTITQVSLTLFHSKVTANLAKIAVVFPLLLFTFHYIY